MMGKNYPTIENDLGHFEGFNHRTQSAVPGHLTAQDVLDWDHDARGEAEFWSAGDDELVYALIGSFADVSCDALATIDGLISELGQDGAIPAIAMIEQGYSVSQLTAEIIQDQSYHIFEAQRFYDARKEAAYTLFETYWPQAHAIWETSNHPDGLIFDTDGFLDSPQCSVTELQLGNRHILLAELL